MTVPHPSAPPPDGPRNPSGPSAHRYPIDGPGQPGQAVEVRTDDRGRLDEVVADAAYVHLEYLGDDQVWMKIGPVVVVLHTKRGAKIESMWRYEP